VTNNLCSIFNTQFLGIHLCSSEGVSPSHQVGWEGSNIRIKCSYKNPRWLKDGEIPPRDINFLNQYLQIDKADLSHHGEYTCYDSLTSLQDTSMLYIGSKITCLK